MILSKTLISLRIISEILKINLIYKKIKVWLECVQLKELRDLNKELIAKMEVRRS